MANLSFNISGLDLVLLETAVKDDTSNRTYHTFRKPDTTSGAFGVQLPPLDDELPTEVTIDGITLPLTKGLTAASYTDRKSKTTVTVPEDERRPKVSHESEQEFPSIGEMRVVEVGVTITKEGVWNVKVSVHRKRTVSPEQRAASAKDRAQKNFDAIAALFATV